MSRTDIQADVVARVLEALEGGELFWRKPWTTHPNAGPLTVSLSSKKPYKGRRERRRQHQGTDR